MSAMPFDPVTRRMITERLGVADGTVREWERRYRYAPENPFPPGVEVGEGPRMLWVWNWDDIAAWLAATGRERYLQRRKDE